MIYKGNTKMTPALNEVIDDNLKSLIKTYSSNKIEVLIKQQQVIPFLTINRDKLKTLVKTTLPDLSIANNQTIFYDLYKNDFNVLYEIADENIDNYSYIAIASGSVSTEITPLITKSAGVIGIIFVRQNGQQTYEFYLPYKSYSTKIYANFNCITGVNNDSLKTDSELSIIINSWNYGILSNTTSTIIIDRNIILNSGVLPNNITVYAFPLNN